jgi:hypothetical protein
MSANSGYSLLKQIPVIVRARGFRLYTQKGQRLIDLWQNGGAAVLGHTPPNILRELKNTASRGLYAPFPHFTESRYLKALLKIFPEYSFRIYSAPPPELTTLFDSGDAKLWRPFIDPETPFLIKQEKSSLLIPVLPGIQLWRGELPLGLCVAAAISEDQLAQFPLSDTLSPVLLAVAARGLYDLLASSQRAKPALPHTDKVLQKTTIWRWQGIYLTLKEKPLTETWETLFRQFLEAGFLLPPTPLQPVILPGEMSNGEDKKLAELLEKTDVNL